MFSCFHVPSSKLFDILVNLVITRAGNIYGRNRNDIIGRLLSHEGKYAFLCERNEVDICSVLVAFFV